MSQPAILVHNAWHVSEEPVVGVEAFALGITKEESTKGLSGGLSGALGHTANSSPCDIRVLASGASLLWAGYWSGALCTSH